MTSSHSLLVSFPTGQFSGSSFLCDEKYTCHENPLSQGRHVLSHVESVKRWLHHLIIENFVRNCVVCSGQRVGHPCFIGCQGRAWTLLWQWSTVAQKHWVLFPVLHRHTVWSHGSQPLQDQLIDCKETNNLPHSLERKVFRARYYFLQNEPVRFPGEWGSWTLLEVLITLM